MIIHISYINFSIDKKLENAIYDENLGYNPFRKLN
jgi:hypothetical protein